MCTVFIAWKTSAERPLVVASNRDEFHQRPTSGAHWQNTDSDEHCWFGGRDERDGGSWLGASQAGRFAVITNHRDPSAENKQAKSRGALVRRWLEGEDSTSFCAHLEQDSGIYNGFNLLFGDLRAGASALMYFGNRAVPAQVQHLAPGIYGLSNALLDTPWPKVAAGRNAFEAVLAESIDAEPVSDALTTLMSNVNKADDEALPQTGVPVEWERLLSSLFIVSPAYGTRAITTIVSNNEVCRFKESRFNPAGELDGETEEAIEITVGSINVSR